MCLPLRRKNRREKKSKKVKATIPSLALVNLEGNNKAITNACSRPASANYNNSGIVSHEFNKDLTMSEPKPDDNHDHQQSSLNAKEFGALTERKLANALSRKSGWFVVEELSTTERALEMQTKRDAIYNNLLRRKMQIEEAVAEKEANLLGKRLEELRKQELVEQRKSEMEIRRQKILADYKQKKTARDFGDSFTGSSSSRGLNSSSSSLIEQNLFIGTPKSQEQSSELNNTFAPQRHGRAQSVGIKNDENTQSRIAVPSIAATPSPKLFVKSSPKSNRSLIINAIQYRIFPGAVSSEQRIKVQESLARSDSKHFLILFRDQKCQYRGLYTWDTTSDNAHKIHGVGPKVCKEEMLALMFKYDAGAKAFKTITGMEHLSLTTDAFTIGDQYWQKPTIPHSGTR